MGNSNSAPLIECVPNFSEGKDPKIIQAIVDSIQAVKGVQLLHVDKGYDVNRTVITFAGLPEPVLEAAFCAIRAAATHIDMQKQKGVHPRFGSTDVCPLIPISNISMEEVVEYSKMLAKRVGELLQIPVYLYESSATRPERKELSFLRKGDYEAVEKRIQNPEWKPDYGPHQFKPKTGNIAIGARPFLIACNVNLKSKNVAIAKEIAELVRTSGRKIKKSNGDWIRKPGKCKALKAIGWYIPEYNCAQVSMNITNHKLTGLHSAYEAVKEVAEKQGEKVNGLELIGLLPKSAIIEAGQFYASKKTLSEIELIEIAIDRLGLNSLKPFNAEERILEYVLENKKPQQ